MNLLKTRRIHLRFPEDKDLEIMFGWRNSALFASHFTAKHGFVSREQFVAERDREKQKGTRHIEFLICLNDAETVVGTVYSFNFNAIDGYAFVNTFLPKEYVGRGYGAEALGLMLMHLFATFPLRKIYADVYGHNSLSLKSCIHGGFIKEGCFKEHRFFDGSYVDQIRLAIYRNNMEKLVTFMTKVS